MTKHDPDEDKKKKKKKPKPKPKPRPRPRRFLALFIIPALMLASCQTGMVRANAIDGPIKRIAARHDAYVILDESLSDDEKAIYLRTTELLKRIVAEAKKR